MHPVAKWQFKIRNIKRSLRGWSANVEVAQNKCEQQLVAKYDLLDIISETLPLSPPSKYELLDIISETKPLSPPHLNYVCQKLQMNYRIFEE